MLGNESPLARFAGLTIASDLGDDLWTPDPILGLNPEVLTGTTMSVQITGGTIDYLAENLPIGTHVVIGEVLAQGTNRGTPSGTLTALPIGIYDIVVTDNLGNTMRFENYQVDPYYFASNLDINGDGYLGGISDLKLLREGERLGVYSTSAAQMSRKLVMLDTFSAQITMETIVEFLRN
jgi:hypothetical protein